VKIEIKSWYTGEILFTHEADENSIKITLEAAVKVGARLVGASLFGTSLDGASLDGASLVGARLDRARLDRASLDRASLVGASLDGAKICLCGTGGCARLRDLLDSAGWIAGADGLLVRKTK
jgi:hypothetical protein